MVVRNAASPWTMTAGLQGQKHNFSAQCTWLCIVQDLHLLTDLP